MSDMNLNIGHVLKGINTYEITEVLGIGGFGITYLAKVTQNKTNEVVVIKEYFPKSLCARQGCKIICKDNQKQMAEYRDKFRKEIERISKIFHPNVIGTIELFEANGTVYYVMEYAPGGSLAKFKQPVSEKLALGYIRPIAEVLGFLHQNNINHLDVKPDNIVLRKGGDPALIDFGIARGFDEIGTQTSISSSSAVSPGYSPLEQYGSGIKNFSPQSDIYALGATLYRLLTGQEPPEATVVMANGLPPMPRFINQTTQIAIREAMRPLVTDRPANIAEFLAILDGVYVPDSAMNAAIPADGGTRLDTGGTLLDSNQNRSSVNSRTSQSTNVSTNSASGNSKNQSTQPKSNFMRMVLIGGAILITGFIGYQYVGSGKDNFLVDNTLSADSLRSANDINTVVEKYSSAKKQSENTQRARSLTSPPVHEASSTPSTVKKNVEVVEQPASIVATLAPAPAEMSASELLGKGLSESKKFRYENAVNYLNQAAGKGNVAAWYYLGDLYYNGNGVNKSFPTAKKYFMQAASSGYAEAQYMLGVMYRNGQGGDKDLNQARTWLQKAASQGHSGAERMLDKL